MAHPEDLKWSNKEKRIARQAFDKAYRKECTALIDQVKHQLTTLTEPDDVWEIHDVLTDKRREIDRKYDYRYSVLLFVFARLLRESWLKAADLDGLADEKLEIIKTLSA